MGSALAVLGAAAVAPRVTDAPPAAAQDAERVTPPPHADAAAPAPADAIGATGTFVQEGAGSLAPDHDPRAITRAEIGVLVSSINELIDTVSQEQKEASRASSPTPAEVVATEPYDEPYVTRINGRTEYVLVRMVQSLMRFMRELRGILTGGPNLAPAIRPAPTAYAGDDLTQIAGLSAAQSARLHTAGVTTYARLAELSPDELRMITLTPDGTDADPAQWQAQAVQFAAAMQQDGAHS